MFLTFLGFGMPLGFIQHNPLYFYVCNCVILFDFTYFQDHYCMTYFKSDVTAATRATVLKDSPWSPEC